MSEIDRFLEHSRDLPLSYGAAGIIATRPATGRFDEHIAAIGHGAADFQRARRALLDWRHFDLGWVRAFPSQSAVEPGTNVAVLIRHLGLWSLNGARVLYFSGGTDNQTSFGFAYGTLTNHAESGEELFEVFLDEQSGDVMYRLRAVSWPQSPLARIGRPIVRLLQAHFRRDSAAAMRRAVRQFNGLLLA